MTSARCAHCQRPLSVVAARRGRLAYGPVCARRLSLIAARVKRARVAHAANKAEPNDLRQLSFELEARLGVDLDAIKAAGLNSEAESMRLLAQHHAATRTEFSAETEKADGR